MNQALRVVDYLRHILEAVDRIQSYTRDMDEARFLGDSLIQDAVIRNLEVIGEASNNIRRAAPEFVAAHQEIPWKSAIGTRNALSHGYFQVDLEVVWRTVEMDLPAYRAAISELLAQLS